VRLLKQQYNLEHLAVVVEKNLPGREWKCEFYQRYKAADDSQSTEKRKMAQTHTHTQQLYTCTYIRLCLNGTCKTTPRCYRRRMQPWRLCNKDRVGESRPHLIKLHLGKDCLRSLTALSTSSRRHSINLRRVPYFIPGVLGKYFV